ncbi:MAG: hypothetical protein F4Z36_03305 [Acidimicrobiia bacterium]|nr:hypothetical protein [Acidimicrobiia bacterium]MYF26314.1 hypothetical protein [Acidimicrobiia bacterium]
MKDLLTICLVPEQHEQEASHLLSAWSYAGLLGNVLLVSSTDRDASCQYTDGQEWKTGQLGRVLGKATYETVTSVVLRPDGPSSDPETLAREHRIAEDLRDLFSGTDVETRLVTVGVANPDQPTGDRAFSPQFNLHLLHDLVMIGDVSAARSPVGAEDLVCLCAMTALLVGGGWSFSEQAWKLSDRPVGNTKPFRIVRPQIRILYGGDPRIRLSLGKLPIQPPWPRPKDTETIRVGPEIEVPNSFGDTLASWCEFDIRRPPRPTDTRPSLWDQIKDALRKLRSPMPAPRPLDPVEQALKRLDAMINPDREESPGQTRTGSRGRIGVGTRAKRSDLIRDIRRAGMPNLSMGQVGTPETWQRIRLAMYGLVDASTIPEEVQVPPPPLGAEPHLRPVWSNPDQVAPSPDAEPFLPDSELAAKLGVDHIDPIDVDLCRAAHRIITAPVKGSSPKYRKGEDRAKSDEGSEDQEGEDNSEGLPRRRRWLNWVDRWRWTPLWTLSDRLGTAVEKAYARFLEHSKPLSTDREYQAAAKARRRFTGFGWAFLILFLLAGLVFLENRTGWIASTTGFVFATKVKTNLDVIAWAAIGSFGLGMLGSLFRGMIITARAYEQAEKRRKQHSRTAHHYAHELNRLHTMTVEFDDHQKVIRTMLHEPFGPPGEIKSSAGRQRVPTHFFPNSMVVATSEADPARLSEEGKKISRAVIGRGWLVNTHSKALELWRPRFEQRVTTNFDPPDGDNSPHGAEFVVDTETGETVLYPRAHFTEAYMKGDYLRRALRIEVPLSVADEGFDVKKFLGPVQVEHGPELSGSSVEDFLALPDPEDVDWFDEKVLNKAASGSMRRPAEREASDQPVELPDGDAREEMLLASWRIPVSQPIEPRLLAGWQADIRPGDSRSDKAEYA